MDKINTQLQDLLQKEMSRKEFLTTLGFGLLSLVGVSSLIKLLSGKQTERSGGMGYGGSVYGGNKR